MKKSCLTNSQNCLEMQMAPVSIFHRDVSI